MCSDRRLGEPVPLSLVSCVTCVVFMTYNPMNTGRFICVGVVPPPFSCGALWRHPDAHVRRLQVHQRIYDLLVGIRSPVQSMIRRALSEYTRAMTRYSHTSVRLAYVMCAAFAARGTRSRCACRTWVHGQTTLISGRAPERGRAPECSTVPGPPLR